VTVEGGQVQPSPYGFDLILPDAWARGLGDLPGWDETRKRLRITGDLNLTETHRGEKVGFLGRAHPIVQRAIERVRHLALGQHQGVDRRVSAAYAPDGRPALIATFLGRRPSRAGREMERVLAIRVDPDGPTTVVTESKDWLPAIEAGAPTRTAWENHFAAWGRAAIAAAAEAARGAFGAIAEEFARDHARILSQERKRLDDWLKARVEEICGRPRDEGPTLFDRGEGGAETAAPRSPIERLNAFTAGQAAGTKARTEAETVLDFYRRSIARLEERGDLREPELAPLGLLLLIPRGQDE